MSFTVTAGQVLVMFVMMGVGLIAYRCKVFGAEAVKGMTNVLLYIVTPCVVIQAFNRPFELSRLQEVGVVFGLNIASFGLFIVAANLIFNKRNIRNIDERVALRFGSVYTNAGFIGIPLAQALLGEDGVFYAVAFVVAFNLVAWTHGISTFDTDGSIGLKQRLRKICTTPTIIAAALAFIIFCLPITLPQILQEPIRFLAGMNTPLSMLVVGGNLAVIALREVASAKKAWLGVMVRNFIFPMIALGILTFIPLPPGNKMSILIPLSCPVAAFLVMFSVLKGKSTNFATKFMCLSTAVSVISVPSVLSLASALWS